MQYSLNELHEKEVVNITDGRRLGYVTDIEIETEGGSVTNLIAIAEAISLFSRPEEIRIPWEYVKSVGDDIIIVEAGLFADSGGKAYEVKRK